VRGFETDHEEDGVEDKGGRDAAQGVHEQIELGLFEAVLGEPVEDLLLDHEITAVDGRETASEVDDGREFVDAVLACVARVADLDERDVQIVRLRVDVLQLAQHFRALLTVVLIEVDGDEFVLFEQLVEHFAVDFFDFVFDFEDVLRRQPTEDARLVEKVAVVDERDTFAEVDQCRNMDDAIFFCGFVVVDLDEINTEHVCFVVDVFQLCEDTGAVGAIVIVWVVHVNQSTD